MLDIDGYVHRSVLFCLVYEYMYRYVAWCCVLLCFVAPDTPGHGYTLSFRSLHSTQNADSHLKCVRMRFTADVHVHVFSVYRCFIGITIMYMIVLYCIVLSGRAASLACVCAGQDERGGGEHARRREAVQRVDADAHPALAQLLQRREAIGADLPRHAPVSHRCCRRRVMMSSPRNVSQPTAAAAVTSSHIVSQRQKPAFCEWSHLKTVQVFIFTYITVVLTSVVLILIIHDELTVNT